MADDPERDLLPVKEGSSFEKQKNVSTFTLDSERDVLHAPYISKLDRNELEDRYMCVMLDNSHLKKECNRQEEKIKRLATKLLRLVAEQKRDIPTAAQRRDHSLECMVGEQQQQIRELQQSNCQLQDRLVVLRNQLVEHTSMHSAVHCTFMGKSRSPARSPARCHARSCTPRSRIEAGVSHDSQNMFQPNSQTNTPHPRNHASPQRPGADVTEDQSRNDEQRPLQVPSSNAAVAQQNQKLSQEIMRLREQISILQQDLETQREQSNVRIGELEDELSNTVARDQRQKVAENVEIIRLKRSLQQQSAHLAAQSAKNQVLEREVVHCQQELEAVQQDSDELHHQLMNERHKVADLQQELQEVGSSRLSIRELQEQIRDIQNERSTLKEHNERLLALMPSRQIQSSEQEVALRSQVRQLESMLANERNERAQLMERIEQLQSEVEKEQANLEPSLGQENALRIQVAQLEAALSTELKERSNLLEALNELRQKMSEPQSSDKENALHIQQVRQLETTLANELDERTRMLQSLEEERTQVSALKVAHSDLLVKLEDLQAQHSKIENQLETLQQKSKLIPEEDYHTSAESPGLMIPDQDSLESNEVNMMAVHSGEDRTATADNLDIRRELEKCRELLRVQYNLNSLYKKEVASLANQLSQSEDEQARKMDEMSKLLQMHTTHISKLQSRLETSELDRTAHDSGHLTIGEGEGIFEIHIESLQLPPDELIGLVDKADKLCDVTCDKIELPSLFLTWVFYDQDVAYTPVKRADTNIEFDSSSVHRVTVDDKFLDYLAEDHCIIEVHMAVDDASETVARGTIHFSELLQFPQNKIHSTVPLAGTRSHEATAGFGIMQCWFRLSCSVNLVSSYVQHRMADKVSRSKVPIPAPRQKKEQISHLDSNKRPENVITTGSPLRTHEEPGDKVGELETESQTRTHEEPGDKDGELETESQTSLEELERESFKRSIHEMSAIKVHLNNSFPKVAEIHVKNIN